MDILYLLVPLSVVLVLLIGALFWWSLQSGQFDDLDTPASMIFETLEGQTLPDSDETVSLVRKWPPPRP